MVTQRFAVVLALACPGVCACGPGGAAADPRPPTPVSISGPFGGIGVTEIRNDQRVVAHTVPVGADSLWSVLPAVYESLGIPEAGGDPTRLTYGNPDFRPHRIDGERLSRFIDCGRGLTALPRADESAVTMSVLTRLTRGEGGGTTIVTTVNATAKPRAESGNALHCPSLGTLEARVVERALRALSGG